MVYDMEGEAKLPRGSEDDWRGGRRGEGEGVGVGRGEGSGGGEEAVVRVGDSTEDAEVHTSGRFPWVTQHCVQ